MSYWYTFSDPFEIKGGKPSAELIAIINNEEDVCRRRWLIDEENHNLLIQDERDGSNGDVDSINEIQQILLDNGLTLSGKSYYQGEEELGGECGVVEIVNEWAEEISFGSVLDVMKMVESYDQIRKLELENEKLRKENDQST